MKTTRLEYHDCVITIEHKEADGAPPNPAAVLAAQLRNVTITQTPLYSDTSQKKLICTNVIISGDIFENTLQEARGDSEYYLSRKNTVDSIRCNNRQPGTGRCTLPVGHQGTHLDPDDRSW